jgi:hypothetical protein
MARVGGQTTSDLSLCWTKFEFQIRYPQPTPAMPLLYDDVDLVQKQLDRSMARVGGQTTSDLSLCWTKFELQIRYPQPTPAMHLLYDDVDLVQKQLDMCGIQANTVFFNHMS